MKALKRPHFSEWSLLFWAVSLGLAIFGFSGLAGTASWIVQVLTLLFVLLFLCASILFRDPLH